AMRDGGLIHIVLVGDVRGPIRNALDASDFLVDRFVARPLSAKALRFAVSSGITAIRAGFHAGAMHDGRPKRSARIRGRPGSANGAGGAHDTHGDGPASAAGGAGAADGDDAEGGDALGRRPRTITALRARWEALADALEIEDEPDASVPPPPVIIRPRRMQSEPGIAPPPIVRIDTTPGVAPAGPMLAPAPPRGSAPRPAVA